MQPTNATTILSLHQGAFYRKEVNFMKIGAPDKLFTSGGFHLSKDAVSLIVIHIRPGGIPEPDMERHSNYPVRPVPGSETAGAGRHYALICNIISLSWSPFRSTGTWYIG